MAQNFPGPFTGCHKHNDTQVGLEWGLGEVTLVLGRGDKWVLKVGSRGSRSWTLQAMYGWHQSTCKKQ